MDLPLIDFDNMQIYWTAMLTNQISLLALYEYKLRKCGCNTPSMSIPIQKSSSKSVSITIFEIEFVAAIM